MDGFWTGIAVGSAIAGYLGWALTLWWCRRGDPDEGEGGVADGGDAPIPTFRTAAWERQLW